MLLYSTSGVFISAYTDTAYDICDRFRTWRVLPAIKRGEITTPGFPASVDKLKTCSVHLQVPQFWWIGIYARNFTLPEGSCVDSTELQISWDEGEKLRHFCGQQKGLIYNHFTALNSGFMHLTFRSIPKHQTTARFHLEYKGTLEPSYEVMVLLKMVHLERKMSLTQTPN